MPTSPQPEQTRSALRTLLDGTWDRRDLIAIATLLLAAAIAWAEYGSAVTPDEPVADTDTDTGG